jgi:hypothetical protein
MAARRSTPVLRAVSLAGLLLAGLLVSGCAGSPSDGEAGSALADPAPEAESGILRGTLTALETSATAPLPLASAGHGRLAAMLVLTSNLPETSIALNVSGPAGQSTEVDTSPILYAFPGNRPTVAFDAPESGDWTALVRLDSGASADYEVHWCADDAGSPGPQDNLACQRAY